MTDPASLEVAVSICGLGNDEATTVVSNLPAGCAASITITQPALGGKRFAIAADNLSIQGAKDVTTALFLHCKRVSEGSGPGEEVSR